MHTLINTLRIISSPISAVHLRVHPCPVFCLAPQPWEMHSSALTSPAGQTEYCGTCFWGRSGHANYSRTIVIQNTEEHATGQHEEGALTCNIQRPQESGIRLGSSIYRTGLPTWGWQGHLGRGAGSVEGRKPPIPRALGPRD